MMVLVVASILSVLCASPVAAYTLPQLVTRGVVQVRSGFETMVAFPTLFGLLCSLVAAAAGVILLARGERRPAAVSVAAGQLLVWVLTAALVLWATVAPGTGGELLGVTYALIAGQVVVAAGLLAMAVRRAPATH